MDGEFEFSNSLFREFLCWMSKTLLGVHHVEKSNWSKPLVISIYEMFVNFTLIKVGLVGPPSKFFKSMFDNHIVQDNPPDFS